MRCKWRIQLLGGLRARRGRTVIDRFRSETTAGLLAYLAYHLAQQHPREVLAEVLWPWAPPRPARNSLNTALSSLRSQLESPPHRRGQVIQGDRFSVGLNRQAIHTDVEEFNTAIHAAALARRASDRIQPLERVAQLHTGELLPGHYQDWVLVEQRRIEDAYFHSVHQLTTLLAETGEVERGLEYAHLAVKKDPLHEDARCDLMRLYAAAGEPAVALRHHADFTRVLREETGEAPSPAIDHLAYRIGRGLRANSGDQTVRHRPTPTATSYQRINWTTVLRPRRVRRELGVSQSRFAELLGVSPRTVQACEQGRRRPGAGLERSMLMLLIAFRNRAEPATASCWDFRNCPRETREVCFVYQCRQGRLCWAFAGTRCGGRLIRTWRDRKAWCGECEFMQHLLRSER